MSNRSLSEALLTALGAPPKPDFETWRAGHADAIAYLNPVVTTLRQRKRRIVMWTTRAAIAAGICAASLLMINTGGRSFAQAVKTIDNAKTVTWTTTNYLQRTSLDGQRTWLRRSKSENAYRQPGILRKTYHDDDGNVEEIEITDVGSQKTLNLNPKTKKAVLTWRGRTLFGGPPGGPAHGPFDAISGVLKNQSLELVGQRKEDDRTVNVFRYHPGNGTRTNDIWIDADTKQLVGTTDPGGDVFDPTTAPDRDNPAEPKSSHGRILGAIRDKIVFDAQLDPELFSMTPPAGYEFSEDPPQAKVTEAELVEFLRATAEFNNGLFVNDERDLPNGDYNKAEAKPKKDRSAIEQRVIDLKSKFMNDRNGLPIVEFHLRSTKPNTFRYLGKGVKLGDASRIVCWYKLPGSDKYRAIFGDLTVKEVTPQELPLPVSDASPS